MLISDVDSCLLVACYPIKLPMELSHSENELNVSLKKNMLQLSRVIYFCYEFSGAFIYS